MFKKKEKSNKIKHPELPTSAGLRKKEQPVIHSMPKRFLNVANVNVKQAKNVGIIILIGGGVVLIIGFVMAFIYFIKIKPTTSTKINQPPDSNKNTDIEAPGTLENNGKDAKDANIKINNPDNTGNISNDYSDRSGNAGQDDQKDKPIIIKKATTTPEIEDAATTPIIISKRSTTTKLADIKAAPDSDGDGLSDREELAINTSNQSNDSDNDGYSDLSELLDLYNPAGSGKLIVNSSIKKFSNPTYSYVLYYPNSWQVKKVGGDDSIIFEIGNNQFIQIIGQTNPKSIDLKTWYHKIVSAEDIKNEQRLYKKGWLGIRSENTLVVYLQHPSTPNILTITYNLGIDETLYYQNIFQMMVNSIEMSN